MSRSWNWIKVNRTVYFNPAVVLSESCVAEHRDGVKAKAHLTLMSSCCLGLSYTVEVWDVEGEVGDRTAAEVTAV